MTVEQAGSEGATEQELTLPTCAASSTRGIQSVSPAMATPRRRMWILQRGTSGEVTIREVEYDVAKTRQAIADAGLPGKRPGG